MGIVYPKYTVRSFGGNSASINLMDLNPTGRFSIRADDYARYRPGYPREILPLLERECGLHAGARVADIGSGTGLLSRLFLDYGCEVFAVEPNAEMRAAAERLLADEPAFHSVNGRAESTGLPDASVEFVTAGQAFHWFEPTGTHRELRRILKSGGWVALIWNERVDEPGFMREYDGVVRRYGSERPAITLPELDGFYGAGAWRVKRLHNEQQFDREGLHGRWNSSSYAPLPGTAEYAAAAADLDAIFDRYARAGTVRFIYETDVYFGRPE